MAHITYKLLLEFLNEGLKISQTNMAADLKVDKSTISRIKKSGKLGRIITGEMIYEQLMKPQINNVNDLAKIYRFLEKNGSLTQELKVAYDKADAELKLGKPNADDELQKFLRLLVSLAEEREVEKEKTEDGEEESAAVSFSTCKYHLAENFVGRRDLIENIQSTLQENGLVILCGMGGLGKSQSALYYAEQGRVKGTYKQVQMVFYNKNLATTLLDIAFRGLKTYQESKEDNEEECLESRLEILSRFTNEALLIIDNMDVSLSEGDKNIMSRLLAMDLHVLITSRNTRLWPGRKNIIKISTLPEEDQLRLFILNYSVDKDNPVELPPSKLEECRKIFQMVSGHTMLIELIAKIMREYSMSTKKIIKVLSEGCGAENLMIEVEKDNNYEQEDIYHSVSALFNISNMDAPARRILMNLSLTSISGIRMSFFDDYLLDGLNIGNITSLVHQSWIIRDSQYLAEDDRIHLHPLIRTAVIRNLRPTLKECKGYIKSALKVYYENSEEISAIDRRDICSIIINAGEMFKDEYDCDSIELLLKQVELVHRSSHFNEADRQCNMALEICQKHKEICIKMLPEAYRLQADIAVNLARYKSAIANYKKAIVIWEKEHTPPYESIAKTYSKLANVYRKNSEYTQALDNFRLAEHRMDVNGVDNAALRADIFNNIGIVYINLDDLDKALENYEKAKNIREVQQPVDKKQLAYSYHNIGTVCQRQHKMQEAVEWHTKALELRNEVYVQEDPVIADSLTMLGNDYTEISRLGKENKFALASDYITRGMKIRENALGPDHPATAWSHESLGINNYYQGNFQKACECFRKCLEIRKKRLEKNHAYTAEALVWLGKACMKCGKVESARDYLEKAYEIQGVSKPAAQKETARIIESICKS